MRRAILIAESRARGGEKLIEQAGAALRERRVSVDASHLETGHKAIRNRIKQAVKSETPLVVLIGGDGTQTIGAAEIAHSKTILGVVPAGTGNSFAESLGIKSADQAYDAIAYGRVERVDVGVVNGVRFANFTTIGLASVIAKSTPRWLKHVMGPIAYGLSAAKPLLRHHPFVASVRWKKNRLKMCTHQIIVVNGRMFGHTPVTPESTLSDGMLTFFATEGTNPIDVMRTYAAFLSNSQTAIPQAHYFRAKKLTVKTSRKALVSVDGSALCKTPAKFWVERNALAVFVPDAAGRV
ncbi:MAG: YegS/Rv2252/BmrU family lipid kinase [Candidatus Eremiobacteraeota bacterium]|nr:YegS/Rv2252/BmrU family lipid kinase [Candidatus Eremiobacteraeota bacterium]